MSSYQVLLYYKYVSLDNPEEIAQQQRTLCQSLNLKGRILIASEGINGTLSGTHQQVQQYITETTKLPQFADIEWKFSTADTQVFPKLKVKVRDEIVTLGLKKSGLDVSLDNKAHYIEPEQLLNLYETEQDFIILDARNEYEAHIGKFKDALIPPIDNFREFPKFVDQHLSQHKDKPIVTYCTGGVRCEKASAYLREQGFSDVRQLHGGVHVYAEKTGGKYFQGELFVFDQRLHLPINQQDPAPIAECLYCHTPITRLIDCAQHSCGNLFNCCSQCQQQYQSCCSSQCLQIHQAASATAS